MKRLALPTIVLLFAGAACFAASESDHRPDVLAIAPDLENPTPMAGQPAPGKQVLVTPPAYAGTQVAHTLYLPTDWTPEKRFPVLIEYRGNKLRVRDRGGLGYGISGGRGFIWAVLPFVSKDHKEDMDVWWGDVAATVAYAKQAVATICARWGGDPKRVVLLGHSRGAIACNYIGLADDEIARLWRAMIPISHYDDGRAWGMTPAERRRAAERLRRLGSIPQFIAGEQHLPERHNDAKLLDMIKSRPITSFAAAQRELHLVPMFDAEGTRAFIAANHPQARVTFVPLPYINHTPDYVLRDIPERRQLRAWLADVLRGTPEGRPTSKAGP